MSRAVNFLHERAKFSWRRKAESSKSFQEPQRARRRKLAENDGGAAATKLMATPETIWPPQWVIEAKLCTSANNDGGEPRPPRRRNRQAGEQQRPGEHQLLGGDGAGRIPHRHHDGARRSEHGD
ncbi:hypothetical protein X729_25250 [Mesorhizobium sp. L103C131B0]|nr:hypothetical protein X729_25250 [Mesorhizobium sp. L103C131B0]